jgi:hypothetical protein
MIRVNFEKGALALVKKQTNEYNDASIQVLEGLEAVRKSRFRRRALSQGKRAGAGWRPP